MDKTEFKFPDEKEPEAKQETKSDDGFEFDIEVVDDTPEQDQNRAPSDVEQIANRLKTLGWEHFRGNWMTSQQISQLPNTDLDLAAREGRVVPGMTAAQVTQILGKPTRVSRLGGSSQLREFWNYSEAGLIIRLRRSLQQSSSPLMVEDVARMK